MSIQDIFYLTGSIYMILGIILLIVIGYVLLTIKNKIVDLHDLIERKTDQLSYYADHSGETAALLGAKAARTAVKSVKRLVDKKGKKNK